MRTSVKQQRILLRQAREIFSVRTNNEVFTKLKPFVEAIKKANAGSGIVSHYRGNTWGVTWIGDGARDIFRPFNAEDLKLTPNAFANKVLGFDN